MTIGFVTELFHPSIGGMEVRYLELSRHLVRQGNAVCVFTIRLDPCHPCHETVEGIDVRRITDGFQYRRNGLGMKRNPWDIVKFTRDLLKQRTALSRCDALIFNIWPVVPPAVVPRFIRAKSAIDWCEIRRSRFWHCVYWFLANPRGLHLSVSDAVGEHLCRRYHVPANRVRSIVSGIDFVKYQCSWSQKRDGMILFLGRLSEHKNPLLLARGFIDAGLDRKGCTLHFVGDGPLLDSLREVCKGRPAMIVHGPVDEMEKIRLLKQSTLLVLPSRREGFPQVIAEAAAAGTPTLTTLHPENGSVSVVKQYGLGWVCGPQPHELCLLAGKHARMDAEWRDVSGTCAAAARAMFDWGCIVAELKNFLEVSL